LYCQENAPDVIALQEVYEKGHFMAVRDALSSTHPYVARKQPSWLSPLRYHNALGFISKYPLTDTRFDLFKANVPLEWIMGTKGALSTTVHLPGTDGVDVPVKMVNVHLTAGGTTHPEDASCDTVRERQIEECLAADPDLFVGDFNTGPEASAANYEFALSKGYSCGFREAGGKDGDIEGATWDPENPLNAGGVHGECPPQRVDHVLRKTTDGPMKNWKVAKTELLFKESVVPITHGKCSGKNVTITDHYGMMFHMQLAPEAGKVSVSVL